MISNQSVTYLEVRRDDGVSYALTTSCPLDIQMNDVTVRIKPNLENFIVPQPQPIVENPSAIDFERGYQEYLGNLPKTKTTPKPIGGVKRKYTPRRKTITGGGVVNNKRKYNPEYQKRYREAHREELNEKAREYHRQKRARKQAESESAKQDAGVQS
jgi:hypothetical protein